MVGLLERPAPPALRREFRLPLYSQTDVARIVGAATTTVHRWARGGDEGGASSRPLIALDGPGRGLTVPFVGLAQTFVLWSFRRAGVPLQRIRPAVEALERGLGLEFALASNRLVTDGAEILLEAAPDADDQRLIVVRNGQAVFNEIVDGYLRHITFAEGYASALQLPRFDRLRVTVDPQINGGRPTIDERGLAIDDVIGRLRAGESTVDVAADFNMKEGDVRSLFFQAA